MVDFKVNDIATSAFRSEPWVQSDKVDWLVDAAEADSDSYITAGMVNGIMSSLRDISDHLENLRFGAGSPEGVVTGDVGDRWGRTDGGVDSAEYVKTSGSGNTGWTARNEFTNVVATGDLGGATCTLTAGLQVGSHITTDTDSADNIGSNATRFATAYVDVIDVTDQITLGGNTHANAIVRMTGGHSNIIIQNTNSDATNKSWRMGCQGFNNSALPAYGLVGSATGSSVNISIGGGTSLGQCATNINMYTAAAIETQTGTLRWTINNAGHLGVGADASYDIGSSSVRPRDLYLSRRAVIGGNTQASIPIAATGTSGAIICQQSNTDSANKEGRIGCQAYNLSQSPFYYITCSSTEFTNEVLLGGGTASGQAATAFRVYTASANNTSTGTLRWSAINTGHWVPGTDSAYDIGTPSIRPRFVYADTVDASLGLTVGPNASGRGLTFVQTGAGGQAMCFANKDDAHNISLLYAQSNSTVAFILQLNSSENLNFLMGSGSTSALLITSGANVELGTASGTVTNRGIPLLPTYTVGTLPAAGSYTRGMIWVSDESGGAQPAYSNGTNWRRFSDGAVVS